MAINLGHGDRPISFWVNEQHLQQLDDLAHRNDRTRSAELRRALAEHLSRLNSETPAETLTTAVTTQALS